MKTTSLTSPSLRFIHTAPLAARYETLLTLIMAFIAAGRSQQVLRLSYRLARLVKLFIRLDSHNRLLERKLSMLCHPTWRARVLRELGGMRKLILWEAAQKRFQERAAVHPQRPEPYERAWLRTPQRIAESERFKAHARMCAKACAPINIVRDRCKMDFDGMFRLAPLSRGTHGTTRQIKIYTQDSSISDYRYNAIPFAKIKGLGPATVWPVEFYTAMGVEVGASEVTLSNLCIPAKAENQAPDSGHWIPKHLWDERNEVEIPSLIPLHAAIDRKTYRDIFENPV